MRLLVALGLLFLGPGATGLGCEQTVLPRLRHLKQPMASVVTRGRTKMCTKLPGDIDNAFCNEDAHCAEGRTCDLVERRLMFLVSAGLNRLTAIDLERADFPHVLIGRDFSQPGIMYLPTGQHPVDVAVDSAQKRLFVLHAQDGNIGVWDLEMRSPVLRDQKPLHFPVGCLPEQTCWQHPAQMKLFQTSGGLRAAVLLPQDAAVAIVNLNAQSPDYGKEVQRVSLQGTPAHMIEDLTFKRFLITNSTQRVLHTLAWEGLGVQSIPLESTTGTGALSPDGQILYLQDREAGGLYILDVLRQQRIPQGDNRFPNRINLYPEVETTQFLTLRFLPAFPQFKQTNKNGFFAVATTSGGVAHVIDAFRHRLYGISEAPSVRNIRLTVDGRLPVRDGLPSVLDDQIQVFAGKTQNEIWQLIYEGRIIPQRSGAFVDRAQRWFEEPRLNLEELGVQVGDQLFLTEALPLTACKCRLLAEATPASSEERIQQCSHLLGQSCRLTVCSEELPENETIVDCPLHRYPIVEVRAGQVRVEASILPAQNQWSYTIRAKERYIAVGSRSDLLPQRIQPGVAFSTDAFALTITPGIDTPMDTQFQFETLSGRSPITTQLLGFGLPTSMTMAEDL
ncbi:MAG: hypothetical protein AAGJ35_07255, partial [Myxococcota bacterium]